MVFIETQLKVILAPTTYSGMQIKTGETGAYSIVAGRIFTMQRTENAIRIRQNRQYKEANAHTVCEFPKNMLMELTNMCNDSCIFCANSKCTRKRGVIKPELAERILKEAYSFGTREIGFYQTGEPLLDQNLERYIAFAKNLGYEYVYITTNGALLTEERAEKIVSAGIDSIKFSINASNPKDYLLIHGKDEFDKVIENMLFLSALREVGNKRKFALYISYVATRYTEAEKDNFERKYRKYVDDIVFVNCVNHGGNMMNEIAKYLAIDSDKAITPRQDICTMIFNRLHVTYEGFLTMCCSDYQNYLVIADLNKESLKDAWNNHYARNLRERHLQHDLKGIICFNCWNNCDGPVEPLRKEYAAKVIMGQWDKSEEISRRIHEWYKDVK